MTSDNVSKSWSKFMENRFYFDLCITIPHQPEKRIYSIIVKPWYATRGRKRKMISRWEVLISWFFIQGDLKKVNLDASIRCKKDRIMQVQFGLKMSLKSWDVDIYGNVKQSSLTLMVSEIWLFFCLEHLQFLAYSTVEKRHMMWKEKIISETIWLKEICFIF